MKTNINKLSLKFASVLRENFENYKKTLDEIFLSSDVFDKLPIFRYQISEFA